MFPAPRTEDAGCSLPQFALTPCDVDGFLDALQAFHDQCRGCGARSEPREHVFHSMVGQGRAFRGAERLAALRTDKALVLARVDANVALAGLASGGARHIGANCCCGVHACLLRVTLGNVPRGVCPDPHFHCKRTIPRLSVELPVQTSRESY